MGLKVGYVLAWLTGFISAWLSCVCMVPSFCIDELSTFGCLLYLGGLVAWTCMVFYMVFSFLHWWAFGSCSWLVVYLFVVTVAWLSLLLAIDFHVLAWKGSWVDVGSLVGGCMLPSSLLCQADGMFWLLCWNTWSGHAWVSIRFLVSAWMFCWPLFLAASVLICSGCYYGGCLSLHGWVDSACPFIPVCMSGCILLLAILAVLGWSYFETWCRMACGSAWLSLVSGYTIQSFHRLHGFHMLLYVMMIFVVLQFSWLEVSNFLFSC
jgi:hypothetical protein